MKKQIQFYKVMAATTLRLYTAPNHGEKIKITYAVSRDEISEICKRVH